MTFQLTPWAIGGGARIQAEVMRLLAYAATDKTEGIVDIGDLRVHQLATAGGQVIIGKGGAVIKNRSTGGDAQSYVARNDGDVTVNIAANAGSSARSDMVIVRIVDPQYSPWPSVPDPTTATYVEPFVVQNVPSTAKKVMDLNSGAGLGYSAIALARIDIPAGTSAITDAMITPLRKMASPRRQRNLNAKNLTTSLTNNNTGAEGEAWPAETTWTVEIPEWATRARVVATWAQVWIPAGNAQGYLWARIGSPKPAIGIETARVNYNTPGSTQGARSTFQAADDLAVPANLRGTVQPLQLRAALTAGPPSAQRIVLDAYSSVTFDVEFLEAPAEDA